MHFLITKKQRTRNKCKNIYNKVKTIRRRKIN